MRKLLISGLALSVAVNLLLGWFYLDCILKGCAETSEGRLGVLTRDLSVGRFDGTDSLFTLPQGLIVRDASASGMDWFEPYRFRLVITSDDDGLVRYEDAMAGPGHGEYYSADAEQRRRRELENKLQASDR